MVFFTSRSWVCPRRAPRGSRVCSQVWQFSGMTSSTLQPVESLTVGPSARVSPAPFAAVLSEGFASLTARYPHSPSRGEPLTGDLRPRRRLAASALLTRYGAVPLHLHNRLSPGTLTGVPTSRLPCKRPTTTELPERQPPKSFAGANR